MKTLYELLGALPDDDAEGLRVAFRTAVRGAHPDLYPDDPDAALRFRQIVRANDILSDETQRAAYDRLLVVARREEETAPRRATIAAIWRVADGVARGVIVLASLMVVSVGGYVMLALFLATPPAPAQLSQALAQEPLKVAAVTAGLPNAPDKADRHSEPEAVDAPEIPDLTQASSAAVLLPASASARIPAVRDFATNDAQSYRERGISAYRSGDLLLALVDFDLAIRLDPSSPDAYVDRAIVFYRLGDRKSAFADVTAAKRIHHESNRNNPLPISGAP